MIWNIYYNLSGFYYNRVVDTAVSPTLNTNDNMSKFWTTPLMTASPTSQACFGASPPVATYRNCSRHFNKPIIFLLEILPE